MKVLALDPKRTHRTHPHCRMRLVLAPNQRDWMCLDCGCYILMTTVEVALVEDRPAAPLTQDELAEEYEKMKLKEGKS